MKLSQIKHALNESKKMIREAEEEFGGDNFDQFLASIKEIEKHARERRVLEPDYSKEDLLADIKREIPDIDDKVVNKMADFVFGHLGESTQVTEAQTAEELEVGEPVKITGNVQFQGATGVIDSFGTGKRFVIVDLGEQGLRSFHSSDVSFNAEEEQDEFEGVEESTNPQDTITMDVPLFIRTLEFAREDAKDDMDLHDAAENALKLSANGDTLTMDNYDAIVPSDAVEEAGPGFVDVTGWSARDVQRLGHEDDDYEEPRRNHGYGYNRPASKPVLSGYYFYNVSPADENDATAIGLKKTKSGKWALAVYNTSGRSTTMKKQSADRAFGPGRWWAPKTESVGEAAEDAFVSALKGLKSWQVVIMNNYYAGKYTDYRGRYYYVIASSADEARQVVINNADAILQDLLSMKTHQGKKILPRSSAIPITDKRIGDIKDGTEAGRMSTTGFKRMFGPQGPMMVKLSGGAVVDVQGQEQGVAEGGPFSYGAKKPRRGSVADLAAKKRKEQDKNYKPTEPKDQMVGTAKVTKGVAESYTGRETKDGTWRVFKDGKAVAVAGPFKSREEVSAWIKKQKQGVAEGSLNETPTIDFIRGLISEFNKQMSGSPYYPMDYKNPGMRMWTRGDGSRYKDPGYIFIERDLKPEDQPKWRKAKAVEKFWKFLETKGARKIGDVSGEFGSDPHSPAVVLNKLIFVFDGRSIAWGSASRLKNSNVWRQKQGVAEGRLHNPGQEDSPVAQAIIRRVLLQRTDLLAKYGPGFVGQAIDDVADSVGAVDEIGSSDVSGWVKQVEWNLKNKLNQYDEPMNMDEASDISGILGAASMVKDYIITAEVDGTTKKFRIRGMTGPRAAKERFLKHAAYAKVLDVKPVEEQKMNEVTLGDYRKKAAMQKAQSQMGAMFARSPEEREKNTATFYKRERGLNRLKARDEAARKAEQERQLADTIARLPELKAEYERMRAEYKSLGGSDWQYADREQNLTDSERKARAMEGPMNNLWRQINAAEKAQGSK